MSSVVIVDGQSVLSWCQRVEGDYIATVAAVVEAADAGTRKVVLVHPASEPTPTVQPPHEVLPSDVGVMSLLRTSAFSWSGLRAIPSVVVAHVARDRSLLDIVHGGAAGLLDLSSGRLWKNVTEDDYDRDDAAEKGNREAEESATTGEQLVARLDAALPAVRAQVFVVSSLRRENGAVVLNQVAVDDGVRRHAQGHEACVALLRDVVGSGATPVMTSAADVLGALEDAGVPLPARVEDPGMACVLLDPDVRLPPPGLGLQWRAVLGERSSGSSVLPAVHVVLDELPAVHDELCEALRQEHLLALYQADVSATVPLFVGIERAGFYVDPTNLEADLAKVETAMAHERAVALANIARCRLADIDLLRGDSQSIGREIRLEDGAVPRDWRNDDAILERLALYGNSRALAVQRLRSLDAVAAWMKRLTGRDRLRSVLVPARSGRWYPRDEALASMPKHLSEARLFRQHLVPEPGHVFVAGDFAAFEPRLLAHQSRDPVLLAGCQLGVDVYTYLMTLLGVNDRATAKEALLAFIYGRSALAFAASLPLSLPDGHAIYRRLDGALATALAFRNEVQATDTKEGRSMYGWRRQRTDQSRREFERLAFNLRMQGSAGDLLRKLLRDLRQALPPRVRVVHQEFDAVILSCPAHDASAVERLLKHTMENVASLAVPLVAKTKHGATLADVS